LLRLPPEQSGFQIDLQAVDRAPLPAILLGDQGRKSFTTAF
jgi:hypothetical protein